MSDTEIFVISLESSTEKRNNMTKELSSLSVQWKFFNGIKINNYPDCYDSIYRKKWFGFDLTFGEVGCFLSHRKLWESCSKQNKLFLILEDDIKIKRNFTDSIEFAENNRHMFDVLRLMQLTKRRGYKIFGDNKFSALTFHEQPTGTQGYFITPSAAKKMIDYTKKIREPVDNMVDHYWRTKLDIFCIEPSVIDVVDIGSDIGTRGWKKRPKLQGLKRDLRTGLTELYRRYYNYKRYKKIII